MEKKIYKRNNNFTIDFKPYDHFQTINKVSVKFIKIELKLFGELRSQNTNSLHVWTDIRTNWVDR